MDVLEGTGLHVRMGGAGLHECERWFCIVAELLEEFIGAPLATNYLLC